MAEIRNRATLDNTQFQAGLKGMQGGVQNLGQALRSMPGIGAALGVAGLTRMIGSALRTADEIHNLSRQMSLGIETTQLYKVALEEAGLGMGTLQSAMDRLAKAEADALTGNVRYQQSFEALGISMHQLENSSPERVLELVGQGLAETGESAEGAAAAYDLFGRNSNKLREVLIDLNKDGIQAQIDKYKELGLVMDEITIRKLDEQEKRLSRAGVRFKNFGIEFLSYSIIGLEAIGALAGGARSIEEIMDAVGWSAKAAAVGVGELADEMGRLEKEQREVLEAFAEISQILFDQTLKGLGLEEQLDFFEKRLEELKRQELEVFFGDDQEKRLELIKEMAKVEETIARLKKEQADDAERAANAEQRSKDAAAEIDDLRSRYHLRNDPEELLRHVISQRGDAFMGYLNADDEEEKLRFYREYVALRREEDSIRRGMEAGGLDFAEKEQFGQLRRMGANMHGSGAVPGDIKENRRLELMRQTQKSNQDQLQVLRDILNSMGGGAKL